MIKTLSALAIWLFCTMSGGDCWLVREAHVTHYAPQLCEVNRERFGVNCQGDPTVTASGRRVEYGVTVACGPNVPHGTEVFVDGVGWRVCFDKGGAILDHEIDVAVPARECEWVYYKWGEGQRPYRVAADEPGARNWCAHWASGERDTVWVFLNEGRVARGGWRGAGGEVAGGEGRGLGRSVCVGDVCLAEMHPH